MHFHWDGPGLWLIVASLLAGALNAVAGGGSFLSFPALLNVGVPPIQANATNTVAVWPGQFTSIAAYFEDLKHNLRLVLPLGTAAAIGGVAGMLIAPVVFLDPNMMFGVLLYGFAGAVLGGLTSPGGAVLGGFAVGVIENLAGTFIPYFGRDLKLTIALLVIVAVLMVRPTGIFGRSVVSRV